MTLPVPFRIGTDTQCVGPAHMHCEPRWCKVRYIAEPDAKPPTAPPRCYRCDVDVLGVRCAHCGREVGR